MSMGIGKGHLLIVRYRECFFVVCGHVVGGMEMELGHDALFACIWANKA